MTIHHKQLSEQPDLSIVIPVFNSERTLRQLVERLSAVLTGQTIEIIFVDDSSSDKSWQVLSELQREQPRTIIAVQLMRNVGQHNALMCGLRYARGKYIITIDDDLQNPPEEIPKLVNAMNATGLDVIYGAIQEKQHEWWRNLGSHLVMCFFRWTFRLNVRTSAFRIMRREVVQAILGYDLNYTFVDGLLAWNTQRIGSIDVKHEARIDGTSGYSIGKLLTLSLNLFTNFSLLPLQVVSAIGLIASVTGVITALYFVVQYLTSQIAVPGYASIIVAVLVLGGVQLLALGVIGEYLGRVHLNINRKPQYTIRNELRNRELAEIQESHQPREIQDTVLER